MTIDEAGVQRWLDAYVDAWRSNDETAIGALFSEDASYSYHPWGVPVRGRAEIVRSWLEEPDPPDSWSADYRTLAVCGDLSLATGTSRYDATAHDPAREYHNLFLLRFDEEGRCREFSEWYMKTPAEEPAAEGS